MTTTERRTAYVSAGVWDDSTLGGRLADHAEERPDAVAVIDGTDGRRFTYRQLHQDAGKVAGFLEAEGVRPGQVVSVQLPNRYESVAVDVGVLLAGCVLNPLLPNYREHELSEILTRAGSRVLVTPAQYRGFDYVAMARALSASTSTVHLISDPDASRAERGTVEHLLAEHDGGPSVALASAKDVSEVIFTSGTEASPKAVMHTEQTTNAGVQLAQRALGLNDGDIVWMPSPIGHSTGLNYGVRLAIYLGLPIVLQDRWNGETALSLVNQHACTYTLAATTFLADLVSVAESRGERADSLRLFGCGGAPVPPDLVRRARDVGIGVQRLYGSTEALVVSWNRPTSPSNKLELTDGLIVDETEVEVRNDEGLAVSTGVVGELFIRGPSTCVGFLDNPEKMTETFTPGGWIRSGDLGSVDAERYVSIQGRKKEILIRGGINIAPREIEDLISEMPQVESVAVVGLPDDRLGEITCACVAMSGDHTLELDELVDFLKGKQLAIYKLPQRLVVLGEFPRTASGKVQKNILARRLLEES